MTNRTYRHTVLGTTRVSDRHLGFPWELQVENGKGSASMTKEELQAKAKEYGLSTDGTKAEIAARIAEHEAA